MEEGPEYKATRLDAECIDDLREMPEKHISPYGVDEQADNDARAYFAGQALVTYRDIVRGDEDFDTTISDFLSDLRHLCDALGVNFDECSDRGAYYYEAEIRGEF